MPLEKLNPQDIRDQILEAANERFVQYGYGKTTMAEIASDCGMSAANLYRYFENKQDIGAALASQCLGTKEDLGRQAVALPGCSGSEKLETFVLDILRYTHEQCTLQPRLNELVDAITRERQDLVDLHLQQKQSLLKRLIEEGNASGEFAVADPDAAANAVMAATFMFDYPNIVMLYPVAALEKKARAVCHVLLQGLRKC